MDIARVIEKIPAFHDLSAYQLQKFLKLCRNRTFKPSEPLCKAGEPSNEMFVVISGALTVSTEDGVELTHIGPGGTVGEMGLVTNTPRCATITAVTAVNALVIGRGQFVHLMNEDVDIGMKIYHNLLLILVTRLRENNQYISRSRRGARKASLEQDKALAASTV